MVLGEILLSILKNCFGRFLTLSENGGVETNHIIYLFLDLESYSIRVFGYIWNIFIRTSSNGVIKFNTDNDRYCYRFII